MSSLWSALKNASEKIGVRQCIFKKVVQTGPPYWWGHVMWCCASGGDRRHLVQRGDLLVWHLMLIALTEWHWTSSFNVIIHSIVSCSFESDNSRYYLTLFSVWQFTIYLGLHSKSQSALARKKSRNTKTVFWSSICVGTQHFKDKISRMC